MRPQRRVAIVQEVVLHYREPFFEQLRARLTALGIDLVLIHSNPRADVWQSAVDLDWAHHVPARRCRVGRRELVYQACRHLLRDRELVIVEQGSRHLLNYLLFAEQALGRRKVALWGHGRNLNTDDLSPVGEAVKVTATRHAHWWFGYTDRSAEIAGQLGVPRDRMTVIQNASDTRWLGEAVGALDHEDVRRTRDELGIVGDHVGLYIGSLAPHKRLGFLLDASEEIRAADPGFELVVVGAGTEEGRVRRYAATRPWVHLVGARHGEAKARILAAADVLLMPAGAGLVVLDSFAAGLPMVISSDRPHGPEVDYLEHDRNGLLVEDGHDPRRYAAAVTELLARPPLRERLATGCRASASDYTVEDMAARFARGIERALDRIRPSGTELPLRTR